MSYFQSVQLVDFPALTLCNPRGHDVGEYVRSVFNNFDFLEKVTTEKGSARLKRKFQPFLDEVTEKWTEEKTPFIEWAG